jgi:hypothetical protein
MGQEYPTGSAGGAQGRVEGRKQGCLRFTGSIALASSAQRK